MITIVRIGVVTIALSILQGCSLDQATGRPPSELAVRLPIAGGGSVTIPFTRNGAVHSEDEEYRIDKATLQVNPVTRQWVYDFALSPKTKTPLHRVRIDDVTDNTSVCLVDDLVDAALAHWQKRSTPFALSSDTTAWLYNQDNTIRIYRFTIEDTNGHSSVLYEAFAYPLPIKANILASERSAI